MITFHDIEDRLAAVEELGVYAKEPSIMGQVCLELAARHSARLTSLQKEALDCARQLWRAESEPAVHRRLQTALWDYQKILEQSAGPKTSTDWLNRTVIGALYDASGLHFAGIEALICAAEALEFSPAELDAMLRETVPAYS